VAVVIAGEMENELFPYAFFQLQSGDHIFIYNPVNAFMKPISNRSSSLHFIIACSIGQ
jgi:hypothetical protein